MSEFYVFQTEQKAIACVNALNAQPYYPIEGERMGQPEPNKQKTERWTESPMLMETGEWAVERVPSLRLDYVGVSGASRAEFLGVYGDDIRALTGGDFVSTEI